jgi:hypothetical protein
MRPIPFSRFLTEAPDCESTSIGETELLNIETLLMRTLPCPKGIGSGTFEVSTQVCLSYT